MNDFMNIQYDVEDEKNLVEEVVRLPNKNPYKLETQIFWKDSKGNNQPITALVNNHLNNIICKIIREANKRNISPEEYSTKFKALSQESARRMLKLVDPKETIKEPRKENRKVIYDID